MAGLPTVGGDDGQWATKLNEFLEVAHEADGTLKASQVTAAATGTGFLKAYANAATPVFNDTLDTANTWQDLNLSDYVGANLAMVYLEVTMSAAAAFAVKPKGYGSATVTYHTTAGSAYNYGASEIHANSGNYGYLVSLTNSSGVVQIASNNNTTTFTVKLIAYVK